MPDRPYLVIPNVSSEKRPYIPMGFLSSRILASNLLGVISDATLYHFGILSSAIHMVWVRQVCGRLKSDYRYSNKLVYNNFPWPQEITDKQKAQIEKLAQRILDVRIECGDGRAGFLPTRDSEIPPASLADLYDPITMPPALADAHHKLDAAVDRCYRPQPFTTDRQRFEYLFALYETLTAPLTAPTKKSRRRTASD